MTIERLHLDPPINIRAEALAASKQVFAQYFKDKSKWKEIPPNYAVDITPPELKGSIMLHTRISTVSGVEDTVGRVDGMDPSMKRIARDINWDMPLFVLATLDSRDMKGVNLHEVILYRSASRSPKQDTAGEEASVPADTDALVRQLFAHVGEQAEK